MSDELEQFAQRLGRQPLKPVPPAWRAEILGAARAGQPPRRSRLANVRHHLAALLWPHPVAWAGLATVWIFILALNVSTREATPMVAKQFERPSPEMIGELKKQQRMFAELVGSAEVPDADRPKVLPPKPRSERMRLVAA
jgi:hypothetical protein